MKSAAHSQQHIPLGLAINAHTTPQLCTAAPNVVLTSQQSYLQSGLCPVIGISGVGLVSLPDAHAKTRKQMQEVLSSRVIKRHVTMTLIPKGKQQCYLKYIITENWKSIIGIVLWATQKNGQLSQTWDHTIYNYYDYIII